MLTNNYMIMKTLIILISSMLLISCLNSNLGMSQIKDDFQIDSIDHTYDAYYDVDTVPPKSTFDGILGLYWGMRLENAISELSWIGIRNYQQLDDESILYNQKVAWEMMVYDAVVLSYYTSNKQNKYLSEITFMKAYRNARDASQGIEKIVRYFNDKEDVYNIEPTVDNNGFKEYLIYHKEGAISVSRVQIFIEKNSADNVYVLYLCYNGILEAGYIVHKENGNE